MLEELRALYRDVDALFASASCDASTECCRFGITGREPQVTSIEVALVQYALKQRGGALSPKRRALPLSAEHSPDRERICPLLDRDGRCSIYRDRPLGCRTFFCSRAAIDHPPSRQQIAEFVRRLQDLAARHEPNGDRPRALTAAWRSHFG
jgi:Fe-S-cluster containining protein